MGMMSFGFDKAAPSRRKEFLMERTNWKGITPGEAPVGQDDALKWIGCVLGPAAVRDFLFVDYQSPNPDRRTPDVSRDALDIRNGNRLNSGAQPTSRGHASF